MPLKPFARPRQSLPASRSPGVDSPSSRLPGTPTPLHGKSSLSRSTTFGDEPQEAQVEASPVRKRLPRATIHAAPVYATSTGTQTSTPSSEREPQTPTNSHVAALTTPITRSRSRLSLAPTPGSPYYSPDSPSQISRSTIIPFDIEGSRRAAKERRSESNALGEAKASDSDGVVVSVHHGPQTPVAKVKGRLASLMGKVTAPQATPTRRRGVVRKRSLWDRISHLPSDIADQYLPDTFALPPNTALPIALFLHILHFLVRAPLFLEPRTRRRRGLGKNVDADWDDVFKTPEEISRGNLERFERVQENAGGRRGVVSASGSWIYFLLVLAIAAVNAWYLFNSYRRYDLRYRTTPVDSPHAKTVPKPELGEAEEVPESRKTKLWNFIRYYLSPSVVWRFVNGQYLETGDGTGSGVKGRKRGDTMQVLNIWDPSDFSVVFFSYFSPLHVLIAQLFYPDHYLVVPLILALLTAHLAFLINQYQWLVKDRMTLNAEVMREYDQGFVYPKLFATRMDKSVQTNEAEMLH